MDSVIDSIVSPIINSTVTPLFQRVSYLLNAGANVRDLEEISKELNQTRKEVQDKIETAAAGSDEVVPAERVKEWIVEVKAIEAVIQKIDEDYNRRMMYKTNLWSRYRIGKRAAEAALEVKELISKRQRLDVLMKKSSPAIRKIPSLSKDTLPSTERYLEMASEYLQDEEVGMVGIWGMGGVGKTTLLQRINNHSSVEAAEFDYVIWVVASQELNIDRLQKDIAKRVGLTLEAMLTVELQALALHRYLMMKSFLLLLDDIWVPLDLGKLGIPCPITSSDGVIPKRKVVVFTTRSELVCDQMTAYQRLRVRCKKIKIDCLQPEEAWTLFHDSIGESMRSILSFDNRVHSRAAEVANKCGGLPLALVVIAQAMSGSKTWHEWEVFINSLNRIGIQEMWINGDDPFPLLKASYDRLPNDSAKKCFLSCVLWPEDHSIFEHDLIDCWLGMNLIDDSSDYFAGFSRGQSIIRCLRRACLLEEGDVLYTASVKMHDIIRGMALWIISDHKKKWMIINRAKLKHESQDATEWREAEAISLMYGRSGTLPQHPYCPNLLFLLLMRNSISMIPEGFFQNMHALTCLDLSWTEISELPPTIGCLVLLRYLNLSSTTICSIPMELANISELKYLLLSNSPCLRSIPRGLILRLQNLERLDLNCSAFDGWDMEGQASIEELVCSRITSLSLDFRTLQLVEQLSKNNSMSMRWLTIRDLGAVTTLPLESLLRIGNTRCTLIELLIWDCDNLEEILIGNIGCLEEFESFEQFGLRNLPALKRITCAGVTRGSLLRNIRFLSITSCPELINATWILQFPHLESLLIQHCGKMEHVIGNERDGDDGGADEVLLERNDHEVLTMSSNLMRLQLVGLPQVCSFSTCVVAFPSLKYISIVQCPKLDEAPFSHLKIHRKYEERWPQYDTIIVLEED